MAGSRTLNILIVHGIGWGQEGTKYAQPLQRNISAAFERALGLSLIHISEPTRPY